MFRHSLLLTAVIVLLSACQSPTEKGPTNSKQSPQKTDKTEVSSSKSASEDKGETKQVNGTANTNSDSNQQAGQGPATSNGLYYSVEGKDGEVIIVNKKHPLDPSYAPGENPVAKDAFLRLLGDMRAAGFVVSDNYSGFRNYEYQANLYQSYLTKDSQAVVDTYSARPGFSEHQTGLAFDIMDGAGALMTEPNAAAWVAQNAHQYGFIVRYPQGKQAITGFDYESWHIRYIGSEATDIYQSGLTLEEYYGVPGGDYTQ